MKTAKIKFKQFIHRDFVIAITNPLEHVHTILI